MRGYRHAGRTALFGLIALGALSTGAPARAPQMIALSRIEPGQWQLKEPGTAAAARSLCVADPTILLQLAHAGAQCSRLVITDAPDNLIVHYTCPGTGHGRTTIAVETSHLLRLQTQGIASGAPFDLDYEARRIGDCPTKSASAH